mgnify:CR=1 FL=1
MIIDFQHHYTPPQLVKGKKDAVSVGIDERGGEPAQRSERAVRDPTLGDTVQVEPECGPFRADTYRPQHE